MEIISKIALITINETLIAQIISFLIFLFIMNRVMIRPLRGVMGEREDYTEGLKQEITDAGKEMTRIQKDLETRESQARKEAFGFNKELESASTKEAVEIYTVARDEIDQLKKDADKAVQHQIIEARKYIEGESEALATHIMEKVLDRRLVK